MPRHRNKGIVSVHENQIEFLFVFFEKHPAVRNYRLDRIRTFLKIDIRNPAHLRIYLNGAHLRIAIKIGQVLGNKIRPSPNHRYIAKLPLQDGKNRIDMGIGVYFPFAFHAMEIEIQYQKSQIVSFDAFYVGHLYRVIIAFPEINQLLGILRNRKSAYYGKRQGHQYSDRYQPRFFPRKIYDQSAKKHDRGHQKHRLGASHETNEEKPRQKGSDYATQGPGCGNAPGPPARIFYVLQIKLQKSRIYGPIKHRGQEKYEEGDQYNLNYQVDIQ